MEDELLNGEIDSAAPEAETQETAVDRTIALAMFEGNLTEVMDEDAIGPLGALVVQEYELDEESRSDWKETAEEAIKAAAQKPDDTSKDYPWPNASNVNYPLITVGAMQFNARAYPAIVKGDQPVLAKVIGSDKGRPFIGEDGKPAMNPETGEPVWAVPPGSKASRAHRVAEFMNVLLMYKIDDWEVDTDQLLMDLPVVGCAFRKLLWQPRAGQEAIKLVSAMNIVAPKGAVSIKTTPRLTEIREDVYPYEIRQLQRSGEYRDVELAQENEDPEAPRCLLEQTRLIDMDGDGLEEPYIVTVDKESAQILRIEAAYGPEHVQHDGMQVQSIDRQLFYVKYDFLPDPEGGFYGIGLGHLLKQIGAVVDTSINALVDASHAQAAGGGFIASGLNLQAGKRGTAVSYEPGVYQPVAATGNQLREGIVDITRPTPSPVLYNVLEMMLGAAQDISSAKEVLTGEGSNNGQVGTTLALIEQGLQVFMAIYKRVYRSLKQEYGIIYETIGKYGGEDMALMYATILDDPLADFQTDFNSEDMDIRPVADPSNVTKMQKSAHAQMLLQLAEPIASVGGNVRAVLERALESLDIEDIEELLPPQQPEKPDPTVIADTEKTIAETEKIETETEILKGKAQAQIEGGAREDAEAVANIKNTNADTLKKEIEAGTEMARA